MSNFHCFASRIFESLGRVQLFYVPQAFLLFLLFNIQKKNALCLLQQVFFVVRLTGLKMTNLIYPPLMIIMSFDVAVQHTDYES